MTQQDYDVIGHVCNDVKGKIYLDYSNNTARFF